MALDAYLSNVRVRYSLPWDKAQNMPGGETYEDCKEAARIAMSYVRSEIKAKHTRSGHLATSMRSDVTKAGVRQVHGYVRSTVEHAEYFFYGTAGNGTGRIYPQTSPVLVLLGPKAPGPRIIGSKSGVAKVVPVMAKSVRGQVGHRAMLQMGADLGVARVSIARGKR